jgi:hypothetical protein
LPDITTAVRLARANAGGEGVTMAISRPIARARESKESKWLASDLEDLFKRYPLKKPSRRLLQDINALNKKGASWVERMRIVEDVMRMISNHHTREGIKFTLELIMIFLEVSLKQSRYGLLGSNDASRLACITLYRIIEALDETDRGLVDPIFQPKTISRRPPDSRLIERFKCTAAAGCEVLMNSDETRDHAASKVAKWASGYKLAGERSLTSNTILGWRKRFKKTPQFEITTRHFRSNMATLRPQESLFSLMDESVNSDIKEAGK